MIDPSSDKEPEFQESRTMDEHSPPAAGEGDEFTERVAELWQHEEDQHQQQRAERASRARPPDGSAERG